MASGFVISQKWDIDKRKFKDNAWEIKSLKTGRKVHTARSYTTGVKWIKKYGKKY